jgi:hypothetical protein
VAPHPARRNNRTKQTFENGTGLHIGLLPRSSFASSSQQSVYNAIDLIPHWASGEPPGIPPRQGTPEHDAYKAKREQGAMRR